MFQFDNNLKSVLKKRKENKEQQINRYKMRGLVTLVPEARVKQQVAQHVASFEPFKRSIYKQ